MSADADDSSNDVRWQQDAAEVLAAMLMTTDFVGGILLAITPAGRVVPVAALPGDADIATDGAAMLRSALEYVEAGRFHVGPKP